MAHAAHTDIKKKAGKGQQRKGERGSVAGRIFIFPATVSKPELLDSDGRSDRGFRQLLYDFSVLGAHLEFARAYLASQLGLSSPQYNIVMIIAQYQGAMGVSVSEVAQHLHVSTAFITAEVQRLEKRGLVRKYQNPKDGRSVLLRLSATGEQKVLQIGPKRLLVNDHLFRGLSGEDFRHLALIVASLIGDFAETTKMLHIMTAETMARRSERLNGRDGQEGGTRRRPRSTGNRL
jgi:DNA-binding MarR family transcriptional regulator